MEERPAGIQMADRPSGIRPTEAVGWNAAGGSAVPRCDGSGQHLERQVSMASLDSVAGEFVAIDGEDLA